MARIRNFSKTVKKIKTGAFDDFDSPGSNGTLRGEQINEKEWRGFFAYYRYYVDEFAADVLGLRLYPFQRLALRAMARSSNSMFIACRGLGKSWLAAVFLVCSAILYPGLKCGIASGRFMQARNVIEQKIKNELARNENIKREIQFPITLAGDACAVSFKNGSEIRAISVDNRREGEGARSWRFQYLVVDEARLVKDGVIEEVLVPMTKTKREAAIVGAAPEKSRVIFLSSAYLKISPLYSRFRHHFERMCGGGDEYFACALPWQVGAKAGIFDGEDITRELDKPSGSADKFDYEFGAVFVGSSGDSYYPYEITAPCRGGERGELEQPKKTTARYVIAHDVALSDARGADNACTHVIKLRERANGTFKKSVVFTKVMSGASLPEQRDFLRELVHLRFPNAEKLVLDTRGSGEALPSLFYETWDWASPSGERFEFPPIVRDDDERGARMDGAMPLIRCVTATNDFNVRFYPYMKGCLQDRSLELLRESDDADQDWKEGALSDEEFAVHKEHDALVAELSNIREAMTESQNTVYERIVKTKKRDRATSLMYGLSVIHELEAEAKGRLYGARAGDFEYRAMFN